METEKMARQKALTGKVNYLWFENALLDAKRTKSDFARAIGMHPSQITKLFRGTRRLQNKEAEKFAELTRQPITDVLANCGLNVELVDYGKTTVELAGTVNAKMQISTDKIRGVKAVPLPAAVPKTIQAVRFETRGTPLEAWDGAIAYFAPLVSFRVEALGHWCAIELGSGRKVLRVLRRGYSQNKFNLLGLDGTLIESEADVKVASPVVWLKMF